VSAWTVNTMEQPRIHRRLVEAGVTIMTDSAVLGHDGGTATLVCTYTGRERSIACDGLVSVTFREPLAGLVGELAALGVANVQAIGDAHNPGTIADAVHAGRLYAEELLSPVRDRGETPFLREVIALA
jgi:dimethylamine/trimethylamine dehydrogenase